MLYDYYYPANQVGYCYSL